MKRIFALICACVCLAALFPVRAYAAAQINITITPTPDNLLKAGTVSLNIKINVTGSNGAAITNAELYMPGIMDPLVKWQYIDQFNPINETIHNVYITEQQIDSTTFMTLKYKEAGVDKYTHAALAIHRGVPSVDTEARVSFSRASNADSVTAGTTITLTYWVGNTGSVPIEDITVFDEPVGLVGSRDILQPGDSVLFTSTLTVTQSCSSAPELSYVNSQTGKESQSSLDPLIITVAIPKLTVSLDADTTQIEAGDTVLLTYNIVNEGNVTFYDLQISDSQGGMIPGRTELTPGGVFIYTRKENLIKSAEFSFNVKARDSMNNSLQINSNVLKITVEDSVGEQVTQADVLHIEVLPSTQNVTAPGEVTFTITVSNRGEGPVLDLTLSETLLGAIESMDQLPVGDKVFMYTASISETTSFSFNVVGKLRDGTKTQAFTKPIQIDALQVQVAEETLPPWENQESPQVSPTNSPHTETITIEQLPSEEGTGRAKTLLFIALCVIGVLIVICVIALIVITRRNKREGQHYYYPDRSGYNGHDNPLPSRDGYAQPPVTGRRHATPQEDERTVPLIKHPPSTGDVPTRPIDRGE